MKTLSREDARHRCKNVPLTPWKLPIDPEHRKTQLKAVRLRAIKKRQARKAHAMKTAKAQVSTDTRERLYQEALQHPAYEGLTPDQVQTFVNHQLDTYLRDYPDWYGHLETDKPRKPITEAQRQHLARMLQRKKEVEAEAAAPYVPEPIPCKDHR